MLNGQSFLLIMSDSIKVFSLLISFKMMMVRKLNIFITTNTPVKLNKVQMIEGDIFLPSGL